MCLWIIVGAGAVRVIHFCGHMRNQSGRQPDKEAGKGVSRVRAGRSLWLWLLPVFVFTGMMRADFVRRGCERELKLEMDGVKAAVSGTVQTVTEREDGSVMILLEQCTVEKESSPLGQEQDLSGVINLDRLQVYLDGTGRQDSGVKKIDLPGTDAPTICPGNQVHMTGTICAYDTACNPGEFDYQLYYRSLKLNYRMFAERYQILDGRKNRYRTGLWRLGRWASGILERTADPKESGIYQAVLLGNKNEMDPSVGNMYQKNGIAHLLAVSGVKTLKLDIPLVPETRINWAFVPLHIAIIYILKLCLDEEIIPRCRFPCSRGYFTKCINWQKKQ